MNSVCFDVVSSIESIGIPLVEQVSQQLPASSPSSSSRAGLRRARREEAFLQNSIHAAWDKKIFALHAVNPTLSEKNELILQTIAKLEEEIQNKVVFTQEDKRLLRLARKLKTKLEEFIPRLLIGVPVPGCCLYSGKDYLRNVVTIAEKQERVENAIKVLKGTLGMDIKVHEYFQRTLDKIKQGINVPLPDFFHATSTGFQSIIETQIIKQSLSGAAGPGTYVSCNNEGNFGYGAHAFAIDERCLIDTQGTFFTGRKPQGNIFYSLWAAVLTNIPIAEETIAFIDTSRDDVPYVKALLQMHNLNIEVVDRATSDAIQEIFDISTKRRELPSFHWNKRSALDYLPSNMYPRSELGSFREFMPTG